MALRRRDLARLGGFGIVGGVLAEDHILGRIVRKHGMRARVVLEPVENRNVACTVKRTLERHTRWAKLRRAISPTGFTFEPLLSPTITCTTALLVMQSRAFAMLLAIAVAMQIVFAQIYLKCVRGRALPWKYAPLELVRTTVLFVCWLAAWSTRRIAWRGHPFVIGADSAITPVTPLASLTPPYGTASRDETGRERRLRAI
jgi:ceramide glucosyltransferase